MNLLPPHALEQIAWVHKLGATKYGAYNWRVTGVCASTYVSAIMRHLNAWRDGEDLDPESGRSHIAHIAASCNILLDAEHCGTLQDDRNKKPVAPVAESPVTHPPYPPVPEGFSHWVDRGMRWKCDQRTTFVARCDSDHRWSHVLYGCAFGFPNHYYLEAVRKSSPFSSNQEHTQVAPSQRHPECR